LGDVCSIKKRGKEREEGKEKYLYPHLKNIYMSSPSPPSKFSKFK
jgi:hypothetical protein